MKKLLLTLAAAATAAIGVHAGSSLAPMVEAEEVVYRLEPANNGAGPMWCSGSTCLARLKDRVWATGLETLPGVPPLNNCRWTLWERGSAGWTLAVSDDGRTREPSPVALLPRLPELIVSANPTLVSSNRPGGGPAHPTLHPFHLGTATTADGSMLPQWTGEPKFSEHSYRSLAADADRNEVILFQNIDYTHAEWSWLRRGRAGAQPLAQGQLPWPAGTEADAHPVRVCYPNVALHRGAVHFVGVSDIIEPNPAWRAFKRQLTGQEWDYDFRRLFYTECRDLRTGHFEPWLEVASRESTCGWISPGDLWVAPDETVSIVWTERALDERLRSKFFPDARQRWELNFARIKAGRVVERRTLAAVDEGERQPIPYWARFHMVPGNHLVVVVYFSGTDSNGRAVSENRVAEILRSADRLEWQTLSLREPFNTFFTATPRAGSAPSHWLDLLGTSPTTANAIRYARIRL